MEAAPLAGGKGAVRLEVAALGKREAELYVDLLTEERRVDLWENTLLPRGAPPPPPDTALRLPVRWRSRNTYNERQEAAQPRDRSHSGGMAWEPGPGGEHRLSPNGSVRQSRQVAGWGGETGDE